MASAARTRPGGGGSPKSPASRWAPLSATGSALAIEAALGTVARLADHSQPDENLTDWLRAAFDSARDRIAAFSSSTERSPGQYATTLAVAILTGDLIAIGQVGDSIAVVGGGDHYLVADPSPDVEYINETDFITASDWLDHLRVTVLAGSADVVALSTDGLRFKLLNLRTKAPFTPFFADLKAYAQRPEATSDGIDRFLTGLGEAQSGDDKSLVAAVQVSAQEDAIPSYGGAVWPILAATATTATAGAGEPAVAVHTSGVAHVHGGEPSGVPPAAQPGVDAARQPSVNPATAQR
jgi:hypothetical protein